MFIAMAEDLRVVFIKLSDRVHNMKTLKFHPKNLCTQSIKKFRKNDLKILSLSMIFLVLD